MTGQAVTSRYVEEGVLPGDLDAGDVIMLSGAGVFVTLDGQNWRRLLSTSAWPGRPLSGFLDESRRSLYVAMLFGGIIRIDEIGPVWHPVDLTAKTGAPSPAGPPAVYLDPAGPTQHVFYAGTDGHVHELWWGVR